MMHILKEIIYIEEEPFFDKAKQDLLENQRKYKRMDFGPYHLEGLAHTSYIP